MNRTYLALSVSVLTLNSLTLAQTRRFDPAAAVQRGCDILLEMQENDATEWPYEGVYRVGGQIPVGYHVGGTSICARALIEAPGYRQNTDRQAALRRALEFVLETLDHRLMASGFKGTYDVRGWGHTYALIFLLRLDELGVVPAALRSAVREKTKWLVRTLIETEIPESGGWNYSRRRGFKRPGNSASPFMTAPTLQALFRAAANGHAIDPGVVERALESLDRCRTKSGGYTYSSGRKNMNKVREKDLHFMDKQLGAVGRMVVVEATLKLAGRGDDKRLARAVDAFFKHWQHLKDRKQKNGTHIPPGGVAPYYFMFAHRYAAQAIEMLPASKRNKARKRLLKTMARELEQNGGWNDRVFDRSRNYGTAFGMLALMQDELPDVPNWRPNAAAENASMRGSWMATEDAQLLVHIESDRVFVFEAGALSISRAAARSGAIAVWNGVRKATWQTSMDDDRLVLTRGGVSRVLERATERPAELTVNPAPLGDAKPSESDVEQTRSTLRKRVAAADSARASEGTTGLDSENATWAKETIARFGWIDAARFGPIAAQDAMAIVQHGGDRPLMLAAINGIEADVAAGHLQAEKFCMLFDRLQDELGRKQRFGSRVVRDGDSLALLPIEDPDHVDQRRSDLGLAPLEDYLKAIEKQHGKRVRR